MLAVVWFLCRHELDDVLTLQGDCALVASCFAEAIDDVAIVPLRLPVSSIGMRAS